MRTQTNHSSTKARSFHSVLLAVIVVTFDSSFVTNPPEKHEVNAIVSGLSGVILPFVTLAFPLTLRVRLCPQFPIARAT